MISTREEIVYRILKIAAALAVAQFAAAASTLPCAVASLSSYDASGFSCAESGLTFSNFRFLASGTAALPADGSVELTPLADGFDFTAPFTASAGTALDITIEYVVSDPAGILGDQLSIAGFGASGSGALDLAETVCPGAVLTCAAPLASLNVFDNATGFQSAAAVTFAAPQSAIGIVKDLSLTGGSGLSSAAVSLIDNATPFAASGPPPVPEPGAALLIGLCLLTLAARWRKLRR